MQQRQYYCDECAEPCKPRRDWDSANYAFFYESHCHGAVVVDEEGFSVPQSELAEAVRKGEEAQP